MGDELDASASLRCPKCSALLAVRAGAWCWRCSRRARIGGVNGTPGWMPAEAPNLKIGPHSGLISLVPPSAISIDVKLTKDVKDRVLSSAVSTPHLSAPSKHQVRC